MPSVLKLLIDRIDTPIGELLFVADDAGKLRALDWKIPCGVAISYGKLAEQIARPKAVRAVGLANGANPIGIVVPCHRVIGANGSLTGYGGGLERKRWLLEHERRNVMDAHGWPAHL